MVPVLIALFALYVIATAWQGRRALAATDPQQRRREAMRLMAVVTLGVPLALALIFVA
ncbi:MAG: hypothetical protein WD734_03600 [Dehalococcoidia bacterium]